MRTLGGILYTISAVIYAQKRPDPFPKVFGFHEVFHSSLLQEEWLSVYVFGYGAIIS
jgi:predicted membrane channel-forming protein YqfA (hemolysin III family)